MKLKYFMRGFGIGVVFTTLIVAVALSASSRTKYTNEEIISKAQELGMGFEDDFISSTTEPTTELKEDKTKDDKKSSSKKNDKTEKQTEETKENEEETEEVTESQTQPITEKPTEAKTQPTTEKITENHANISEEHIKVEIKKGMWSNHLATTLKELNLIDDAYEFDRYLINNGYQNKIRTGIYNIKKGSSYYEIAEIVTGK